jgi:hypothetical protein
MFHFDYYFNWFEHTIGPMYFVMEHFTKKMEMAIKTKLGPSLQAPSKIERY